MKPVPVSLKPKEMVTEHASQNAFSPRQFLKDIGTGKRNVQKKSARVGAADLTQVTPHQHQVIVVCPDKVFAIRTLSRGLRKFSIDALIDLPIFGIEVAP